MSLNLSDFSIVLEQQADGTAIASVLELPHWVVKAATKEQALTDVRQMLSDRLQQIEIIPAMTQPDRAGHDAEVVGEAYPLDDRVEASKRPWREFADMFKDDPYFAQIMDAIQAERDSDDDSEVDPSVYGGDPVKS
jgi:predicted RNase H-like HicB family nuclease